MRMSRDRKQRANHHHASPVSAGVVRGHRLTLSCDQQCASDHVQQRPETVEHNNGQHFVQQTNRFSKEGSRHSLREICIADQRISDADKLEEEEEDVQKRKKTCRRGRRKVRGRRGAEEEEGVEEGLTMPAKTMSAGGSAAPYM